MAYDLPEDTSDWVSAGRGRESIFAKPPTVIALEPDVAKVFKNSETVNRALRKLLEALPSAEKKKKTA